jgi:hypothetical protein
MTDNNLAATMLESLLYALDIRKERSIVAAMHVADWSYLRVLCVCVCVSVCVCV